MKSRFIFSIFLLTIFLNATTFSATAQEQDQRLEYKRSGFFLGGELGVPVIFDGGDVFAIPGKLDFLVGYQINPYFSVAADLWTFWLLAYVAEAQLKVNFLDAKISPYAVGSVGVGASIIFDEETDNVGFLTYSGGFGVDFHLGKREKAVLFTEAKYRGGKAFHDSGDFSGFVNGMEVGVGFRWLF